MSKERRLIENIKSAVLVLLFLTTILLLYLLWGSSPSRIGIPSFLSGRGGAEAPQAESVVTASSAVVGNADGTFSPAENTEELFDAALTSISGFPADSGVLVSPVSHEQYVQALGSYESVIFFFDFDFDFPAFCSYLGLLGVSGGDQIADIDSISFSSAARESIIVRDGAGLFYRLVFSEEREICDALRTVAKTSEGVLYPAGEILGGDSMALLPLSEESILDTGVYSCETDEAERLRMAEYIFGDTFDFVRRISDSFGNITYMYGYGQKTFSVYTDGSCEYRAEPAQGESGGFLSDLQTALDFAAGCGGWDDGLRLASVTKRGSGRDAEYSLGFIQTADGLPICSEDHYAVEISVTSGQITRYYRRLAELSPGKSAETRSAADPANVLASNCNHIYNISKGSMLTMDSEEALEYVSNSVSSICSGYFLSEKDETLVPCWMVRTDEGSRFYFDLYSARPLGFMGTEE